VVLKDSLQLELKFEDDDNVLETFSDMLESIFINLDNVAEKLVEVINSHDKGNKQPPSWLLGYEFIDVAMEAMSYDSEREGGEVTLDANLPGCWRGAFCWSN
jgi:hypothetical protein